jgi:UDP-N-acetylmuramate--alanine ligase
VVSTAIREDNPELIEAKRLKLPVIHRAEKLAQLVNAHRGIAIAGTHGKTTTSSMVATLLSNAGIVPSYVVGGIINSFSDNARAGNSDWFVIEADESDGSLVQYRPEIAVLTNIELDHMDFYRDKQHLLDVFSEYVSNIRPGGLLVYCADDPQVRELVAAAGNVRSVSYGLTEAAKLRATNIIFEGMRSSFTVMNDQHPLGRIVLRVPGLHNVQNSLAAIAIGLHLKLSFQQIEEGLSHYAGVQRRFQILGKNDKYCVVDDYAHHPSEIRATLSAARGTHTDRIIGIFQPHRYSRTQSLARDFGDAFDNADEVVVTDIYAAGEMPIPNVTSDLIVQSLRDHRHPSVHFVPGLDKVEEYVVGLVRPKDLVITLGAGDIWKVAESLSRRLTA